MNLWTMDRALFRRCTESTYSTVVQSVAILVMCTLAATPERHYYSIWENFDVQSLQID